MIGGMADYAAENRRDLYHAAGVDEETLLVCAMTDDEGEVSAPDEDSVDLVGVRHFADGMNSPTGL